MLRRGFEDPQCFHYKEDPLFIHRVAQATLPLSLAMCVELVQDAQYPHFIKHRVYTRTQEATSRALVR